ncbi:MAG: hypothetical protein A3I13_02600 [Gammaproteobacteria bacterium RIFCSPLOWO2_02_FULL_47_50]|nr:MAG: hypothetical protein A3I13_02600 [Gammaproteobacteria bacterium RIFCSPLOWO2_02_FULL_47_50]OGT87764.1 MAG: hypothetical protein A3G42_02640 [Gammaproteobacteria bacterium RIFCSPLOWO2_12_FULL_47_76]
MKKLLLKEAFNSTFHKKLNFDDLLNLEIINEYTSFNIRNKQILNPSEKLKKYHRFLNSFIFDYAKINTSVVHSYRKEKTAYTAVSVHANSKYFFQSDINDFFNSITATDIKNVLNSNLDDSPISDIVNYKDQLINIVTVNNILPIGFSTSPNISNTCLYNFDNSLETYCNERDINFTRYADDIILSSNTKESMVGIEEIVSKILNEFFNDRFVLNQHKTKRLRKGNKVKLLGMVILPSGKVTVDMKLKKQLEILLHFYINDKDKFSDYLGKVYSGKLSTISGQLNYINTVDKNYLNKLRKKYGNYIVDLFFHSTVK